MTQNNEIFNALFKEGRGDWIELVDRTKYFLNWILIFKVLIFKVFVSVIFIFGAKDLVYPTAQCLYLFYEACGALVSWCKESKSTKSENDRYVVAKINRAKTSKGSRNRRCLSEGRGRISGEVLPKWTHMHKPQNGCFPTFLFCDLTGIRGRQELSFMPPLNFGGRVKTAKHCQDQNCRQTS